MKASSPEEAAAKAEFEDASLPDARLNRRLLEFVGGAAADPSASIPTMTGSEAAREAAYRFLSNQRVEFDAILEPHLKRTRQRVAARGRILAVHDTSTFKFEGSRGDELGYINTGAKGFFLHATVAVVDTDQRECLGVLAATTHFRESLPTKKGKQSGGSYAKKQNRESDRWWEHVEATEERLAGACDIIHVADSEADNYTLLSKLCGNSHRFVIRMARDRRARTPEVPWSKVSNLTAESAHVAECEVPLSARGTRRPPKALKKFPPRDARTAKLRFAAMPLQIKRPQYLHDEYPRQLDVNVVRVYEVDAPMGTKPVEWFLFTSEPVGSREELLAVVDMYRRRWLIEEFFRAVKTGCGYEKRQLEGRHAWLIALAITLPLAWRLLQLKQLPRAEPSAPASKVLTETEIKVLRHLHPSKIPVEPTLRQAMLAIAEMGGHAKSNGEPGWLVLHRGLSKLQSLAEGVELAQTMTSAM